MLLPRPIALATLAAILLATGCANSRTSESTSTSPSTSATPDRDKFLETYAATYRFSHGQPKAIRLTPDGSAVLFLRSGPRSFVQDLYQLDVATGQERVLLTAQQILSGGEEKLSAEELARRERMRLAARGITSCELSKDGNSILVPLSGKLFVVDRNSAKSRELPTNPAFPIDPHFSPDASMVACVRDGDLYLTDLASNTERRITTKASPTITNALAEFVAQEEMDRFRGYWFSPDGKFIAYQQTDTAGMEEFHIADPVNPGKEADTWPYPRPGKKNADVKLFVVPVAGGTPVQIGWDSAKYPYLANVSWQEGAPLTILVQNRAQTEQLLYKVNHFSADLTILVHETDPAWLNLRQDCPKWLKDGSGFLWISESSGDWQLQLRNPDGSLARTLTPKGFGLRSLSHFDQDSRTLYLSASTEPTETHLFRLALDANTPPQQLSSGQGSHGAVFAEKSRAMIKTATLADGNPTWSVLRADGSPAADIKSVAEQPGFIPNAELLHLGGPRDLRAVVVRPRSFVQGKKLPVLVSVYGGPHSQTVSSVKRSYILQQWLADQGFIVLSIDGRGTPARGRDWEREIKNDVISGPLDDQVEGLRQAAARVPEMDLNHVGIYGWSFGGYFSAMAVMRRPDVFHAGCAGAPVADWLDYDTHYTERYLGVPDVAAGEKGSGMDVYTKNSVLTYCKDLSKPLLIIHGTADDNVYFMHSLKMTGSLFRAGKDFNFLPLAGFTHMVPDPVVTTRLNDRIADFFIQHLQK